MAEGSMGHEATEFEINRLRNEVARFRGALVRIKNIDSSESLMMQHLARVALDTQRREG